jgi:2-polyprenyl-6-hydroxyphenyl methylase/3-demethylubiquinone-9 3-methyltransferase
MKSLLGLGLGLPARVARVLRGEPAVASPAPATVLDAEYAAGRWSYFGNLSELARYSVLVGYLRHFKPGGAVLDIGCGEGLFLSRLHPDDYCRYLGVDLSSVAIAQAGTRASAKASFAVADARSYQPTETFDAIVMNELLHYIPDAPETVGRLAHSMRPGSVLLLSTCTASGSGMVGLSQLQRRYVTLSETRLGDPRTGLSWVCAALAASG